ncbi:granzyme G-like [Oreochromis aureus]|uniref:trypsin n=1 Tax=Oreochromis aureus TaxID=47969 RepID=A0A668UYC4_OREAU|nr:granzyme G-like [Oreochromis aureus]XP_039463366.1 granzyme G-like [Oreochromis aureus]
MFIHCNLATLIFVLTLDRHVYTILGGHEAVPHSRPYMVFLERHMSDGRKKYYAGFLLNEDFVMTAAHCQAKSYIALLGVHHVYHNNEIQRISVEQPFPHKYFNQTSFKNDVMLLKLSSKAILNENVKPIPLASHDDGTLPKSCIVSGWGRADRNRNYMSPKLMETSVTLIDNKECAVENFYCSQGETGPSEGDSGGPLVCEDGKAYGVISSAVTPHSGGPVIIRFTKIPESTETQHHVCIRPAD